MLLSVSSHPSTEPNQPAESGRGMPAFLIANVPGLAAVLGELPLTAILLCSGIFASEPLPST
jgi:hypothetical protein